MYEMDAIDWEILKILSLNHRTPLTSIAKKLDISRFEVRRRLSNLFKAKAILGPTIILSKAMVGYPLTAFFEFKTNPREPWLACLLEGMDCCESLDGVIGEYSLIARFRFRSYDHLNETLRRIDEAMSKSIFKKYRMVNVIHIYKEGGAVLKGRRKPMALDDIDLKILNLLSSQWRAPSSPRPLSTVEVSKRLRSMGFKASQPTVSRRILRLEEDGAIAGYTMLINYGMVKIGFKLILKIKVDPLTYDKAAYNFLAPMDEVIDLYRTGEDYGLLAVVRVESIKKYDEFLKKLYSLIDIIDTFTILVLEERIIYNIKPLI